VPVYEVTLLGNGTTETTGRLTAEKCT